MTLTFQKKQFDAAWLGSANVLPTIQPWYRGKDEPKVTVADGFRKEEGEWVYRGNIHTILPYTALDEYDRNIEKRDMDVAILENEYLRATFMLDLGGRLWSLYSKTEIANSYTKTRCSNPQISHFAMRGFQAVLSGISVL